MATRAVDWYGSRVGEEGKRSLTENPNTTGGAVLDSMLGFAIQLEEN